MSLRRGLQYFALSFGALVVAIAIWQRIAYEHVRKTAGPYLSDVTEIGQEAETLSVTLTVTLVANLLLLILAWWILQSRVLKPLNVMRNQLKQVAQGDLHQVIEVSSPSEIRAAAYAAERMRRNLVHQLDVAYSAWAGLEQNAPLVALMRRALEPAHYVTALAGLDMYGVTLPAKGVIAGDWWDVIRMPESTAIVVVDIAGHGPEAAILGLQMKSLLSAGLAAGLAPGAVLNRISKDQADVDALSATSMIVIIPDDIDQPLSWLNAGHPSGLLRDRSGTTMELGPTGPMIGGFGGYWETQTLPFNLGDRILLMTDGVIETRLGNGQEYGFEAIAQHFASTHSRDDSEAAVNAVLAKVRHESVTWDKDDITLVSVLRKARA